MFQTFIIIEQDLILSLIENCAASSYKTDLVELQD